MGGASNRLVEMAASSPRASMAGAAAASKDRSVTCEGKIPRWRNSDNSSALSGESNTPTDADDQITITIRPQHWFKAKDITFTGDTSAKIDTIFFGERPVWNNSSGVPVSVFSSTGMLRGLLAGQKIRPGLDIVIKGTAGTASTTTTATVIGYKPLNTSC